MEYAEEPDTKILMKVALRLNNQNTLRKSKELKEKKREREIVSFRIANETN